jgi:uncharacterized protein YjbI with pentapeptide repeats
MPEIKQNIKNGEEYVSQAFLELSLSSMVISSVEFDDCSFTDCDFSGGQIVDCKFTDCRFEKCNFSNAGLGGSRFLDVSFEGSKMIGLDWTKVSWPLVALSSPVSFSNCNISDSSFFGLNLEKIQIEDCKSHDVDFREGNFRGADFGSTDLSGSLFRNTNLTDANFIEAINYDIDILVNKIRNARFSRYEAIRLLNCLNIELVD